MKSKKRWSVLSCVLAFSLVASACGSGDSGSSDSAGSGSSKGDVKQEAPMKVSIMTTYYTPEPPGPDNVIVKEFEKRTNTDLDIIWVSSNNYGDKLSVTLASGDIPDLVLLDDPFNAQVRSMVAQGAFWDITDVVKDYPNLMKFPDATWNNQKQRDGRNYGVPRVRPVEGGSGFIIREDWLNKLNLPVPQTTDELYTALKAFKDNNPDGLKPTEVVPFAGATAADHLSNFIHLQNAFTGTHWHWKEQDGELARVDLMPEVREFIVYMKRLYDEKLIPEDFAVLKGSQVSDLVKGGKAGVYENIVENSWEPTEELRKTNPDATFLPLVSLNGFASKDNGSFGMFAIPKKVSEEKMKKLVALLDYGASEEGSDLANYGFEGVHHTLENGFKVSTEQAKTDIVAQQALGQIFLKYDKYLRAWRTGIPTDMYERNKKIIDEREKISIPDPATGLYSETNLTKGGELDKKIFDLKVKVIMGVESLEAWDQFVEQLRVNPDLIKITDELNQSYKARLGAN